MQIQPHTYVTGSVKMVLYHLSKNFSYGYSVFCVYAPVVEISPGTISLNKEWVMVGKWFIKQIVNEYIIKLDQVIGIKYRTDNWLK